MNKTAAIQAIISATSTAQPVVFTTDSTCRIAQVVEDRPNHLYLTASTGLAGSLGIGIALETRRPTVIVDSYSNLVRNPVGLITAGTLVDLPLIHIVLDDGLYGSGHTSPPPSDRADVLALARASGYTAVSTTTQLDKFTTLLRGGLANCHSPVLVRAVLTHPDSPMPYPSDSDPAFHASRFHAHLSIIDDDARAA